jgi:6-phosphogluconate dehydrogenase
LDVHCQEEPEACVVKNIFQSIAKGMNALCDWVGEGGAATSRKVQRIEYGIQRLEGHLLKAIWGWTRTLSTTYLRLEQGELDSYLIEITSHIFLQRTMMDPRRKFDVAVKDRKWTASMHLNSGIPVTIRRRCFTLPRLKGERNFFDCPFWSRFIQGRRRSLRCSSVLLSSSSLSPKAMSGELQRTWWN